MVVETDAPPEAPAAPPTRTLPAGVGVAWSAIWSSRLVVMAAGVLGVLAIGNNPGYDQAYDYNGLLKPFGYFGNLLVSPLARWDSSWYLTIAQYGYGHGGQATAPRTTFFPLYPLLTRGLGVVIQSDLIAGVLISLVCFAIALVVLYRLVALELDSERARICVMLIAFCPMAYYFSAVYTESLFLALSVGCIYAARKGRWLEAGVFGALASATRNTGPMLAVPIVLLYLYGPRGDRSTPTLRRTGLARLLPVHPIRPSLAWVLLVPVGMAGYLLFLGLSTGHAFTPFNSEQIWFHHFAGPFGGVWDGAVAAWDGLRQLLHGPAPPVYFKLAGGDPLQVAGQNLMLFGFLVLGVIAFVGVLRRLPLAYGLYALAALAVPLSYPVIPQPLDSLPRYEVVVFPLFMWGADWVQRRRIEPQVLACLGVLLGLFTAEFATWRFVS